MTRTLADKYSIDGRLQFSEKSHGMTHAVIMHDSGAQCELTLYGAHVLSWRTPSCGEVLFLCKKSMFEAGAPIRGGIPVVFPQFGPGPLAKHGFARTAFWDVAGSGISDRGEIILRLRMTHGPEIYNEWPHNFKLEYTITLGETLTTSLRVSNDGETPLSFTAALHTYFSVGDVCDCAVEGLEGCDYFDMLDGSKRFTENDRRLCFSKMIDRRYVNTPRDLLLDDVKNNRRIEIKKVGWKDAVVWNPWVEGARAMEDFDDNEYRRMLCVEAAHCETPKTLGPEEFWIGAQMIHCTRSPH